ncbi:Fe2+-dependent dioxygenase [Undibacterium sp. Tian12W]|uniref:Fe2+-dependent dioxygenase n=1 Tax=Undibacterium sp. Tian12W TaxID=3413054 RepID=UPI003BF15C10
MMLHIPGVLSREQVSAIRLRLDAANWVDGKQTVGAQGAQVKRNRQLPEHSALAQELGQIVLAALKNNPLFFAAALPLRIVPPLFNSYAGGEHYGLHVDGAVRNVANAANVNYSLRTDVSSTLFLCDPEEYNGGELEVVDTYGTHEVKLPAGDLILYPSTSLHQVLPVTRGERVCSFLWTQSMIRDDARRTMLFEMDQNITRLRSLLGDSVEVLSLTGQYHNLLRMWSET